MRACLLTFLSPHLIFFTADINHTALRLTTHISRRPSVILYLLPYQTYLFLRLATRIFPEPRAQILESASYHRPCRPASGIHTRGDVLWCKDLLTGARCACGMRIEPLIFSHSLNLSLFFHLGTRECMPMLCAFARVMRTPLGPCGDASAYYLTVLIMFYSLYPHTYIKASSHPVFPLIVYLSRLRTTTYALMTITLLVNACVVRDIATDRHAATVQTDDRRRRSLRVLYWPC